MHKLFYTPVWEFKYPDFESDFEYLVSFFSQDSLYLQNREKNGLQTTRANLHKDIKLSKLTEFFLESAKTAMNELGYKPDIDITSMWSTRQRKGGFHHPHIHANAFLGAAFHLYDSDGYSSGTTFVNNQYDKYQIRPTLNGNEQVLIDTHEIPFNEGTLIMFPGWLPHYTNPNQSTHRIIVGCNLMPVGMTDDDHYDRYYFPPIDENKLKQYNEQL